MSNPNPVRRHSADAMTARQKMKFPVYVKRQRLPGEAAPCIINTFSQGNLYKPQPEQCARDGADQHQQYLSRGM